MFCSSSGMPCLKSNTKRWLPLTCLEWSKNSIPRWTFRKQPFWGEGRGARIDLSQEWTVYLVVVRDLESQVFFQFWDWPTLNKLIFVSVYPFMWNYNQSRPWGTANRVDCSGPCSLGGPASQCDWPVRLVPEVMGGSWKWWICYFYPGPPYGGPWL